MPVEFVLLPLFAQVLATLGLWFWLVLLRRRNLASRTVHPSQIALREPNWPKHTRQVGNCFANQFELPVLFYVLTILEIVTRHADIVFVVFAWIFVLSRLVHAFIHTTSNRVMYRGNWYGVGALALIAMWIMFMVRILLALP